jgi:hypothetical protein
MEERLYDPRGRTLGFLSDSRVCGDRRVLDSHRRTVGYLTAQGETRDASRRLVAKSHLPGLLLKECE